MVRVPKEARQTNGKVAILTVTPTVLAEAIRAANGDPARLEIVSGNEIIVWNSREQRNAIHSPNNRRPKPRRTPMAGNHAS